MRRRLARQRWERDFASTLNAEIERLLDTPEAATSPIFVAIQAVALRTFDDRKLDDVPSRRLVLVSDLMQNVPGSFVTGPAARRAGWLSRPARSRRRRC